MIASFWQVVGWIAGFLIIAAVVGLIVWRRRRRARRLGAHTNPPPVPRKPNGEDRRA